MTSTITGKRAGLTVGVALLCASATVSAQTPFDIVYCDGGTVNMIYDTKELKVFALEGKGITLSQHENKVLHNAAFEFVGNYTMTGATRSGTGFMSFRDPDGDLLKWEFSVAVDSARGIDDKRYVFRPGTGKWAAVSGEGTGKTLAVGRIKPNTFQSCTRVTGSFEARK